ncbi:MAG TPA: hypothetical protein PKX92_02015 [Edaphocola sp.]|nr:hypothetical protein [Edaphocola sp.]
MKNIILLFLLLPTMMACNKKENNKEYFYFDANGVHYNYPLKTKLGLLGESKSIWAGASSGSLGYFMGASCWKDPSAPGTITFNFPGNNIPTQDTIILDGVNNRSTIERFLNQEAYYKLVPPQNGRIIFTERTTQRLTGTFQFDVKLVVTPTQGTVDSVIHITNGKFSIIPAQ